MGDTRFDALTRQLTAATSRRAGLRAALGGLLGLAALEAGEAGATNRRQRRRKHDRRQDRRNESVGTRMPCDANNPCPDGMNCLELGGRGECICADSGLPPCGTICCPQGVACCDGVCCGRQESCYKIDGTLRCACKSDQRQACKGICCDAGFTCYEDRCEACKLPRERCKLDEQCCGHPDKGECRFGNSQDKEGFCCVLAGGKCTPGGYDCCEDPCVNGVCTRQR